MRRYLLFLAVLGALIAPGAAHADAVTQWNAYASNAIFTGGGTAAPAVRAASGDGARRRLRRRERDRRRA